MASTTLHYLTKGVGLSIWAWDGIAEQVGNFGGFCVTNILDLAKTRTPLSDARIATTSNWANRAKEFKIPNRFIHPLALFETSLNTTGEKVDAFINKKSNNETQNARTCAAIVEAARSADFPSIKEKDSISLASFESSVKKIMTPTNASLSWSDYYGFATRTTVQFGLTSLVRTGLLLYTLSWVPTNSYVLKFLVIGGAATWGYSYLALPHARQELKESINPTEKNKLEPLTKKQLDAIAEQAKKDFSLNNKTGTVNFAYSENWGRFEDALKSIGTVQEKKQEPEKQSPQKTATTASPAKKTGQQPNDAFSANNAKMSNLVEESSPAKSATPKKSKVEIRAPKYEELSTEMIVSWLEKIKTDIKFARLTPEDANIVLKEQSDIVTDYLSIAVKQRKKDIKTVLESMSDAIDSQIADNIEKIERAKLQPKRDLADSFNAVAAEESPRESPLAWLSNCCGRKKKTDEPIVEDSPRDRPRPEARSSTPSTVKRRGGNLLLDESDAFAHINISPLKGSKADQSVFETPLIKDN